MPNTQQSLLDFLLALPATLDAQIFYGLMLGGFVGMIGHYIRARASNNVGGNPIDYFFRQNPWRSLAALAAVAIELFGEVGSGMFFTPHGTFVGWAIVLLSGLKTGYVGDSAINKSDRPTWTEEHRVEATAKFTKDLPKSVPASEGGT
jgi:hypothetical protein